MSVIGGVLLFAGGVLVGGGAVWWNRRAIEREVRPIRKENEHLKTCAWEDRMEFVRDRAWREGYREGRRNPLSDVERFNDTLEQNNITFRMERRGKERQT